MIIEVKRRGHVQRMTYEDFERRVTDGEIGPETLVRFELVTGDAFRPAGELELVEALNDPAAVRLRRDLQRPGLAIATALLVGFQARVYLWSWSPPVTDWLQTWFTNWTPAILEEGQVWRLFSYGLLHVNFSHILFNLLFLAYAGYHLERALGRANLAILYFGSVFTGGLLSMAMAPERPSLGASGGDFGLLAAAVIFGWKHWDAIPPRARKYFGFAVAPYPIISIFTGLSAENVDNWGHLGGLIGGAVLVTALEPEGLGARPWLNRVVRRASVAGMVAVCAALLWAGPRLIPLDPVLQDGWTTASPSYWRPGGVFTGEHGLLSPTGAASLVVATTDWRRPAQLNDVVDAVVERVTVSSGEATVRSRAPLDMGDQPGVRVVMDVVVNDVPKVVDTAIVQRGAWEARIQLISDADQENVYADLMERLLDDVSFATPRELEAALARVETHPRSWEPAAELGRAASRAGRPDEALKAYDRALELSPGHSGAVAGRLRVYADYGLPDGASEARRALAEDPLNPSIVVAAAEVLSAAGEEDEGRSALTAAWQALPGDRTLRKALKAWGVEVDEPQAPDQP